MCTHAQLGPTVKAICPKSCNACPASPADTVYAWKGMPWWQLTCDEEGNVNTLIIEPESIEGPSGSPFFQAGEWMSALRHTKYLQFRNSDRLLPMTPTKAAPDGMALWTKVGHNYTCHDYVSHDYILVDGRSRTSSGRMCRRRQAPSSVD